MCVCVGGCCMYKEILSDHCPFANYEWRGVGGVLPQKNFDSNEAKCVIFESLGLNIHCLKLYCRYEYTRPM